MKSEEVMEVLATIENSGGDLHVGRGDVEVGQTYPIFGMITGVEDLGGGDVIAEINHSIKARMFISESERIELLRTRAFETGIFVSTVLEKEPVVVVECKAVIFGKAQAANA
ncbi:MAG TPA: hypothetical protein PKA63_12560 [Oligoflexia bacterium]|nr:hypothetical protein [Oligoflexia bacterium]HMP49489.1 hypothetical protein [Oligoflexia bacterium]